MLALLVLLLLCPIDTALSVSDVARFQWTPQECCNNYLAMNAYLAHVNRTALPDVIGRRQIRYAEWMRAAWDRLDNAKRCRTHPEDIIYELSQLRSLIGRDAYAQGLMPAPLPLVSP